MGKRIWRRPRRSDLVFALVYLCLFAVLLFSSFKIYEYFAEGKREKDFHASLIESAVTKAEPGNAPSPSLVPEGEGPEPPGPDISVDVAKLTAQYPDVVGWLYSPGTPINYPVVQGKDNAHYVDKLPSGAKNAAGSLFLDFRDHPDLSGFLQVIYGHNMKNNSMFGTLLDYRKDGYFQEHPYLFFFTADQTYRLEVFAGVNTHADAPLYHRPADADSMAAYLRSVLAASTFQSGVTVTPDDAVLMLSTCSGAVHQSNRYVIFAKLVELKETK